MKFIKRNFLSYKKVYELVRSYNKFALFNTSLNIVTVTFLIEISIVMRRIQKTKKFLYLRIRTNAQ